MRAAPGSFAQRGGRTACGARESVGARCGAGRRRCASPARHAAWPRAPCGHRRLLDGVPAARDQRLRGTAPRPPSSTWACIRRPTARRRILLGDADIGFVMSRGAEKDIKVEHLQPSPVLAVMRPTHPLVRFEADRPAAAGALPASLAGAGHDDCASHSTSPAIVSGCPSSRCSPATTSPAYWASCSHAPLGITICGGDLGAGTHRAWRTGGDAAEAGPWPGPAHHRGADCSWAARCHCTAQAFLDYLRTQLAG